MYKIKQRHDDFLVKEVINLKTVNNGNYSYFLLRKRDWSSFKAVDRIAKALKIKNSSIGLAGNKDKLAISEQYISLYKVDRKRAENLRIKDIDLKFIGYGNEKINLGSLEGNRFDIIVRNLDEKNRLEIVHAENYFDEQRFGFRLDTHLVGKAIVKKDFKVACELLGLKVDGNDYIGALRRDDRRVLRFYIHSYESWIWNKVASRYLEKNYEVERKFKIAGEELFFTKEPFEKAFAESENNIEIPIIGYLMDIKDDGINEIYTEIMEEEKVKTGDFVIKQMPEISSEGGSRDLFVQVGDFNYRYDKDEMNKGKYKASLSFMLPKGAYATMIVKRLFG